MIVEGTLYCIDNFHELSKEHWAEFNTQEPSFNVYYLKNLDVILYKDNEVTQGYLFYLMFPSPYYKELNCQVDMFFLRKKYRGRGIGKRMFTKMEEKAKEAGCSRILSSYNNKLPLDGFYASMGYTSTHTAVMKEI